MNSKRVFQGIVGGLAGGLVFGMMMGMMGMLPTIGKMVGQPSAVIGFLVHMVNSAVIGLLFAVLFAGRARQSGEGIGYGALYGGIWWLLGPLTLMPLMMGMGFGVNWNLTAISGAMPSLVGHLMYGVILGVVYAALERRSVTTIAPDAA